MKTLIVFLMFTSIACAYDSIQFSDEYLYSEKEKCELLCIESTDKWKITCKEGKFRCDNKWTPKYQECCKKCESLSAYPMRTRWNNN
jgi:hypothetical protein